MRRDAQHVAPAVRRPVVHDPLRCASSPTRLGAGGGMLLSSVASETSAGVLLDLAS
jgi:hypothetical protein